MKKTEAGPFCSLNRQKLEHEIEDELHFHLELSSEEHMRQGMTLEEARREALKRFGNIELLKKQCVEIGKRSRLRVRLLRSFFLAVFLFGVFIRIFWNADIYGKQIGNMLMVIAIFGSLLLYIRGLYHSSFVPGREDPVRLGLGDVDEARNAPQQFTPFECVIADE